ncbi:MAG TPA: IreB family regulatory phosphoprotein [Tissierellaceae bacterium]
MSINNHDETMMFNIPKDKDIQPKEILLTVFRALEEKGYNPINQIIGYILSGDPTYITSHLDARNLIRKLERDELLEEILTEYLRLNK